jgi:hypothetical protein
MALLNTGCLFSTIQEDVTGITTGYASDCFVVIAGAVDAATTDRCVTVPNSGSLGSLYPTQTIPEGQVVFVEDVGVPVIAASGKWIGFDKRVLRRDLPIMGELYTWGTMGPLLGSNTSGARSSPMTVAGGGTNWCSVSIQNVNPFLAMGLKADGTLWTWGFNSNGQLGTGNTTGRSSPGTTVSGGTDWKNISAGSTHALAVKCDGTLWSWGDNTCGKLGDGTLTARSSPGTTAGGGTNWRSVSAGGSHSAGIKTDGTLWTWGNNFRGKLGDGTTTNRSSPGTTAGGGTNWCSVCLGGDNSVAIKTDGTLWTWGCNGYGRLGDGTTTNRSSPGTTAGGGTNWCNASTSNTHTAAVKTDGTIWTWGYNASGQLGDGTTTSRLSPGTVAGGGTNWCQVSTAFAHTVAIKTDGTLWTWGRNTNRELGDSTATNRSSPGTTSGSITSWFTAIASRQGSAGIKM